MKKALSLILALAMALSLAACGGGKTETPSDSNTPADNTSAEPTKLSLILRGGTYADVIKECLPAFEAEHNVVCEVQELSEGDLYSGIALDAINDKGSYDLCMVDGSWMAEFTENGVLANLTELGYSLDEDVIPATTAICYVGDDLYLAPYYGNVTVLLYNKANVEAAGYTGDTILSLEDMLAICERPRPTVSWASSIVATARTTWSSTSCPSCCPTAAGSSTATISLPSILPSSRML